MPYEWTPARDGTRLLRLWPYRSLGPRGFVFFFGITSALIALPVLALVGEPVLWGLLPFVVAAVSAMWWALRRNEKDRQVLEELSLSHDEIALVRQNPRGPVQSWAANPHWVRLNVHASGGPVPHYVTLTGNGREVEIGAFLSEEERVALGSELRENLAQYR